MKPTIFIAQTEVLTALGKIASLMNAVALILFFGSLLFTGYSVAMGQTDRLKSGLLGAGIGGAAFVIAKALFQASGTTVPGIELQGF